jgi:hypothetical protein
MLVRWSIIWLILALPAALLHAQDPTPTPQPIIISMVDETPITATDLQTRLDLEAWLLSREVGGFTQSFYAQNSDIDELMQTLGTIYGAQLATLADPEAYAQTVLNSLEVDAVLRQLATENDIAITNAQTDALILEHITLAEGVASPPGETTVADFLEAAAEQVGTDEAAIRALFAGRVLRGVFYEAVNQTQDATERTPAQNQAFQEWAYAQMQAADITRAQNWQDTIQLADYRAQVTEAISDVLVDSLAP